MWHHIGQRLLNCQTSQCWGLNFDSFSQNSLDHSYNRFVDFIVFWHFDFSAHPLEEIPPKRPRLRLLGRKASTENRRAQAILHVLNNSLFSFSFSAVLTAVTDFGWFFLGSCVFFLFSSTHLFARSNIILSDMFIYSESCFNGQVSKLLLPDAAAQARAERWSRAQAPGRTRRRPRSGLRHGNTLYVFSNFELERIFF